VKEPLVSIITPTYNHEKYIAECIESVLIQTYQNWEMIIIDDCSQDSTYDIALEYAKQDSRIKVFRHKENYGALNLDKTYNEALSMAKGEWIAILEGDDCWPHYKLERQIETVRNLTENTILLHGMIGYIHEDIKKVTIQRVRVSLIHNPPYNAPYEAFDYLIYGFNPVYAQTALIRKDALLKIGGFIQRPKDILLVDFPTWLRLSKLGQFYQDNTILAFWRRHTSSITMNNQDKIAIAYVEAIKSFLEEEKLEGLLSKQCLGKLQYFGAIVLTILKRDFSSAKAFLRELENCISSGELLVDKTSKLKLLIYKIIILLRQPWILKILYDYKRTKIDKVLFDYEPFFFKKLAKENRILCAE